MDPANAEFDVFLSHNSLNKEAVRQLAKKLRDSGLRVWLDEWNLIPGRPWQEALETIIRTTRTAAVLVGRDGIGPWELPEMRLCISEFAARALPVIPILLPGAPAQCELPALLKQFTWVDLRDGFTEQGLSRIVCGVRGVMPGMAPAGDQLELSPVGGSHYLDFALKVGQREPTGYPVEVVRSPTGTAAQNMAMPFEGQTLQNHLLTLRLALMDSALRSAGQKQRGFLPPEDQQVRSFGGKLFDSLIAGPIRERYDQARRIAKERGLGLRLRLSIEPPEIAVLPWEYVYDSREEEFLCFLNAPLVRHLGEIEGMRPLNVCAPLRILGMVSSPSDLPELDAGTEKKRMEDRLRDLIDLNLVELHWLKGGTWAELNDQLSQAEWHIFHFVGHAHFDVKQGEGVLFFQDESGLRRDFTATQLSRLFSDRSSLRLFVLNACQSGTGSPSDIYSGIAATMVRRGVPAVVAMQQNVSDIAATEFSRGFYKAVGEALPIDVAVAQGRKAMQAAQKNSLEWGTPVLLMNTIDGVLFTRQKQSVAPLPNASPPVVEEEVIPESIERKKAPITGNVRIKLDKQYWCSGKLPITLLVACADPIVNQQLSLFSKAFERPLPVFESCDQHFFATSEQFRFQWQTRPGGEVMNVIDEFLKQNSTRMLVVVSDLLTDRQPNGGHIPSQLSHNIRERFRCHPHFCGLVGLVHGSAARTHDVDRTLDARGLSEAVLRDGVTKVADGLRLKAPPGRRQEWDAREAVVVQLAQTEAELEACFRLRHEIYDRMGYLDEELSNLAAQLEVDPYDAFDSKRGTGALHFVAKVNRLDAVVGTGRLILARRIQANIGPTAIGAPPTLIMQRQAELLQRIIARCDTTGELQTRLNAPRSCTLPLLQSTQLREKTKDTLRDVDALTELSRLVVVPRFRGSGVSKVLIRAMIAASFDLKKGKVILECVPTHVSMYEKYGFFAMPGTHTRAESLDQEAVAMALPPREQLGRVMSVIENDLDMIRNGSVSRDPQMLSGQGHLCLCSDAGCWSNGRYDNRMKLPCPLRTHHRQANPVNLQEKQ